MLLFRMIIFFIHLPASIKQVFSCMHHLIHENSLVSTAVTYMSFSYITLLELQLFSGLSITPMPDVWSHNLLRSPFASPSMNGLWK